MKKEIPILMTTVMVRATLAKIKTMTRRLSGLDVVNKEPDKIEFIGIQEYPDGSLRAIFQHNDDDNAGSVKCPYGKPGDLLWVRETLYQEGELGLSYVADNEPIFEETIPEDYTVYRNYAHCKVPSNHMQKSVARIWLEVTNIRVERLHEITERDVISEGAGQEVRQMWLFGMDKKERDEVYRRSFQGLWQSINGEESWLQNPWVWVVCFKVLSTTGKP